MSGTFHDIQNESRLGEFRYWRWFVIKQCFQAFKGENVERNMTATLFEQAADTVFFAEFADWQFACFSL